jgi:glutamyl-Q tRNA(Asp) synthetase
MLLITRFAPSPTGLLHLGHGLSAVRAHDLARAAGGLFLLRIEDIDTARCRRDYTQAILQDLRWLGLAWDGAVMVQSDRAAQYDSALNRLIAQGLAYKCWCTRADITTPLYQGTCKGRADPGDGRPFNWRLDVAKALGTLDRTLGWEEAGKGVIAADPALHGDVVIARKDALSSYHLAVCVDDAAQGVTDVVRGMDLFASTHVHVLLQVLLGFATPRYHHHPLIVDDGGEKLAKRRRSPSLRAMREAGVDPARLVEDLRAGILPHGFRLSATG